VALRPLSLQARSTFAAFVALVAFLGLTGFALDQAYYDAAVAAMRDRLQSYVYAYLAGIEVSRGLKLIPPETPPNPDFARPGSGLYAVILGEEDALHWESPSALGRALPLDHKLQPNAAEFDGPIPTAIGNVFVFSQGVSWEVDTRRPINLTVHVAQSEQPFKRQIDAFRSTLARWLGGLGLALLFLQLVLLRWGLLPLRRVKYDVDQVMRGDSERLPGSYPPELTLLANSLNEMIAFGREQLERYRNTMSDLAHSLKTPLAVLRSELDGTDDLEHLRKTVGEQTQRMHDIVSYQLSRATAGRHEVFSAALPIEPAAEGIVTSLEKVYKARKVLCEFDIDPGARFFGAEGDLMELMGNLLENGFKWARSSVLLTVKRLPMARGGRRAGLEMAVEDDGPGIPEEKIEYLLQRGVRGDERVQGHGIGLAIVQDIVKGYRGKLEVRRSESLGGAAFVLRFEQ
jgi:two-component system sensor histidine kinase PhoQ